MGKSGQIMCVMTSRHSCGEDWKVNEAFKGITVIKMQHLDDVTPELWQRLESKQSIQGDYCNKDVASGWRNATAVA